ncbi:NAC domain-containing protein 104-like isoform X1 [Prunus yedoensis var. nudiflora]|uniref:NAC domain-containing protein 104-like isoform X1 n=1 Tax=Prunus yedoensis var. nudiflora TaxID=2094558 RepID=A0A314ZAX4_PRUYE|nr:NAC domain-containing protein 104-like isoform X1 [Prunus yedoensis var. nudiflora]
MGDPKATSLRSLPPGCRFYPSEEQLLCCYLSNKNDADPAQSGGYDLIRELDLYDHDPFDLPDSACYSYGHAGRKRHWFCYTVRVLKERRAKSGYWRRKGRDRDVVGRGGKAVLGRRTSFVFYWGIRPTLLYGLIGFSISMLRSIMLRLVIEIASLEPKRLCNGEEFVCIVETQLEV